MQGATPEVRRAEALASTTPAPADLTPVEVAAIAAPPQVEAPDDSTASYVPSRPGFAALIGHDRAAQEQRCLAEAIYFEARGESDEGQAAVAQVVMNRVSSGLYPPTICGVVFQNRHRRNACQFSFACEGRALRITEADARRRAVRIAGKSPPARPMCQTSEARPIITPIMSGRAGPEVLKNGCDRASYILQAQAGPDLTLIWHSDRFSLKAWL